MVRNEGGDTTLFAWHVHHDVLVEPIIGSLQERIEYIQRHKPEAEQPLRLRLLKEVKGELPAAYLQAGAAYSKAGATYSEAGAACDRAWAAYQGLAVDQGLAAYDQAWAACDQAWAAYDQAWDDLQQALAACMPAILVLHASECPDCPWNGQTIFPKKKVAT